MSANGSDNPAVGEIIDDLHRQGLARLRELLEGAEVRKGELQVIKAISQCWIYTKRYGLGAGEEADNSEASIRELRRLRAADREKLRGLGPGEVRDSGEADGPAPEQ